MVTALGFSCVRANASDQLSRNPDPIDAIVDYHHAKIYVFSSSETTPSDHTTTAPGVEIDWGFLPRLTTQVTVPYDHYALTGMAVNSGAGDIGLGLRYEIVSEARAVPSIGVAPVVTFGNGAPEHGGNGRNFYNVPLFVEKSLAQWTFYATAGFVLNDAPGHRNYDYGRLIVQRTFGPIITVNGSVYAQGPDTVDGEHTMLYIVDATVKLGKSLNLLMSIGHSFSGESRATGYAGLYYTL